MLDADLGAALKLPLEHGFLGARAPEINGIDGVIGRLRADKTEADFQIIRPDLALARVECLHPDLLGALDARSRRSPQMQLHLAGIHDRKILGPARACD